MSGRPALGLAALVGGFLALGCSHLLFVPETGLRITPAELGLRFEERRVQVDGLELYGWFLPAAGPPVATVVFFHGNAENISTHVRSVAWLPARGISVLAVDYRGYGRSQGRATLAGAHRDVVAILLAARRDPAIDPERIVVFGQSLGGALALPALAELRDVHPVRAAVIDAAPSDYRRIARDVLKRPLLTRPFRGPLSLLAPSTPKPTRAIRALRGLPILLAHGGADPVVPVHHSRALADAAGPGAPIELWIVPGAGHTEVFQSAEGRDVFLRFTREAVERPTRHADTVHNDS